MLSRDRRLFFLRWLKSPLGVGVPVASGKSLARAMAAQLSVSPEDYVLELGPGTGAVTRAIMHAGVNPERLIIIERDKGFKKQLQKHFPHALILIGDARNLREMLAEQGIEEVAAVVSSLPLLNMPHSLRHAIVNSAFEVLRPDGAFIQYTYGFMSPLPADAQRDIGIRGRVAKRIWRNFPPARVWRYQNDELA